MENQQMGEERLDQYLNFIKETELLKNVLRTAWGSTGRQESTAEHSWRLALSVSYTHLTLPTILLV